LLGGFAVRRRWQRRARAAASVDFPEVRGYNYSTAELH